MRQRRVIHKLQQESEPHSRKWHVCNDAHTVIVLYTRLAPPGAFGSVPYLQMMPLASQLAHRGFCSSPKSSSDTYSSDRNNHQHFLRLLRQVRQPVRTLCLPAGVGFRGILGYEIHL